MDKRAFTLIELIIVIIIVGILASTGIMLMSNFHKRAIASEAVAAMAAIRTGERVYCIEHGDYIAIWPGSQGEINFAGIGLSYKALQGTYFAWRNYSVIHQSDGTMFRKFRIWCVPADAPESGTQYAAPKRDEIVNWQYPIMMDQDGNIYSDDPALGYENINGRWPTYG